MPFTPAELRDGPLHFLLDLAWGGTVYRVADAEIEATIDGEALRYSDGLEFEESWEDSLALFATSPAARSVSLTIHLAELVDVPARIAEGHDLGAATAELWLWPEGADSRRLLLDGRLRQVEYESADDPVTVTLESQPLLAPGLVPEALQRVQTPSEADATDAPSVIGQFYPLVFGRPGNADSLVAGLNAGGPVLIHQLNAAPAISYGIVAAHPCIDADVVVRNASDETTSSGNLLSLDRDPTTDVVRTRVALNPAAMTVDDSPMWITWTNGSATPGAGLPSRTDPTVPMRAAGEILLYLLERSGARIDFGRMAALAPLLSGYLLDFTIIPGKEARVSPLEFVEDHFLPVLALSANDAGDGLYYVLWRWDAQLDDAVASIDVQAGQADRVGAVEYSDTDDLYQQITLNYAKDYRADSFQSQIIYTGDPDLVATDPTTIFLDPFLEWSFRKYAGADPKQVRTKEVSADIVDVDATAHMVARGLARRYGIRSRLVRYETDPEFAWLEPGMVISIRDTDVLGSAARVALVDSVMLTRQARVGLGLRIISRPARYSA